MSVVVVVVVVGVRRATPPVVQVRRLDSWSALVSLSVAPCVVAAASMNVRVVVDKDAWKSNGNQFFRHGVVVGYHLGRIFFACVMASQVG